MDTGSELPDFDIHTFLQRDVDRAKVVQVTRHEVEGTDEKGLFCVCIVCVSVSF
jgi:hypothetical protein